MDEGSLQPDILSDNIDALGNFGCCNWAAGVQKQFATLGLSSIFRWVLTPCHLSKAELGGSRCTRCLRCLGQDICADAQ